MIILSSILPLLLLGFFSVFFITRTTNTSLTQRLDEVLLTADDILSSTIESQQFTIKNLKNSLLEHDLIGKETITPDQQKGIETAFFQTLNRDLGAMNLYYVGISGQHVGTDRLPELYSYPTNKNWGVYRFAQNEDTHFYANAYKVNDSFYNAYSIVYSVIQDDVHTGYLILDVSTEYIQSLFSSVKGTSYGYVQFILASKYDTVIYNDSYFYNNIGLIKNVLAQDGTNTGVSSLKENTLKTIENAAYGYQIYGLIHNRLVYDQGKMLASLIVLLIITTIILSFYIGNGLTQSIVTPINSLVNKMNAYKNYDSTLEILDQKDEISRLSNQFDLLIDRIEKYHKLNLEKQDLMRQAEIKSLMSQINPHFINNTLDSIKWKAKLKEYDDIQEMVTKLSVLLLSAMNNRDQFCTLEEEIEMVSSYISIQQIRYEDRLNFMLGIQSEAYCIQIPRLILQPIIENSIIHGIEPMDRKGIVEVSGWVDDTHDYLYLTVADNGVGTDACFEDISHSGIGLQNVNHRIKLHYGNQYGLWWESKKDIGTVVYIKIPISREEAYDSCTGSGR